MNKLSTSKKYFIFIIVLVIFGGFFRFYNLDSSPYWMDEGYTINAVLSIQENGSTVLDSGNKYSCPTYCYPTAWVAEKLGNSAFSFRLLSAIAGVLFIILISFITKRLLGTPISIIATIFTTFSYWQIAWSHQARWYTLFSLFFWVAIFLFYKLLNNNYHRNKQIALIFGVIGFTFLSCITHGLGYLLPFIFVFWYFIDQVLIKKKMSWNKLGIVAGITLGFLFMLYVIMGVNLLGSLFNKINFSYVLPYYASFLFRSYWLFIVFSLYALFVPLKKEAKNLVYFLLLIFISYLIPLTLFTNIIHYRYLFYVTPVLIIVGSIGMYDAFLCMRKRWLKISFFSIIFLLFFTVGGGILIPKNMYILEADDPTIIKNRSYYAFTPQPNWNKAYEFMKTNGLEKDVIISSMPQFNKIFLGIPGYWIEYDYLGRSRKTVQYLHNKEFYVAAEVIKNLDELKNVTSNSHGFVVLDYMGIKKIDKNIIRYIEANFDLVFYDRINSYSKIWVFMF